MNNIRNFSIIAHIDHGKSTLADRMLEVTGTIEARKMQEQVLDSMELERERGITIKMQPVRMKWTVEGAEYQINLIDTPGHVDFAYEVSRALTAVEGVVLLVDATQGVEAQTLSTLSTAKELGKVIIPVLSKVDAPAARVDDVRSEVALLLECEEEEIYLTSGKTGMGVADLLNAVVVKVPPPVATGSEARALIFDFQFSEHRGVLTHARVVDGSFKKGDALMFMATGAEFIALEVGVFTPKEKPVDSLKAGEIGYIVTGIKEPGKAQVGDTIKAQRSKALQLDGYRLPAPVIWASVYPEDPDQLPVLRLALGKLRLSDSSLTFEEESSGIMGRGFRCGFLGMLHMEIIVERLRREFSLELVVTLPTVEYEVELKHKGGILKVYNPTQFPDEGQIERVFERFATLNIYTPTEYISGIMQVLFQHEGEMKTTETLPDGRVSMLVSMPLRELMRNFFDRLKNVTSGFASLSYGIGELREADVLRMDILVVEEPVPAFTRIVPRHRAREEGEEMVKKLRDILPQQLFVVKIQARADGKIVASERISAARKDVTGYLYGGDITRKMKLLEKQKKGKERRGEHASLDIPHDVFIKVLRNE
ncbi:MAG: elongation factor 4 [Candidatus Parcubacteria bacterium]|jgi:GTP-binding protein LepA